jgi:hypothetical protein
MLELIPLPSIEVPIDAWAEGVYWRCNTPYRKTKEWTAVGDKWFKQYDNYSFLRFIYSC